SFSTEASNSALLSRNGSEVDFGLSAVAIRSTPLGIRLTSRKKHRLCFSGLEINPFCVAGDWQSSGLATWMQRGKISLDMLRRSALAIACPSSQVGRVESTKSP